MKIIAFKKEHLKSAVQLFIEKYQYSNSIYKILPSKYLQEEAVLNMLSNLISKNPAYVAVDKNEIIGYISGISNIKELKGSQTGVYVPEYAHAVKLGCNEETVYSNLYKVIANEWVCSKNYTHAISFYGHENKLHSLFFELGFGMLTIDGLRDMSYGDYETLAGVETREMIESDLTEIEELHTAINSHLLSSPIYLYFNNPSLDYQKLKQKFIGDNIKTFVALKDNKLASAIRVMLHDGPGCKTVIDTNTLGIDFAYTKDEYRGTGITAYLLANVLKWGSKNDMIRCVVDFESQNRVATKFWLKNFQPICKTLIRKIDDRF